MAQPKMHIRVESNRFPDLINKAPDRARELVKKAAYELEARAKTEVPVDTGNLRNSIRTSFENGGLTGIVSTNVEYAAYVEFGTVKMAAQPYMTPAAEQVRKSFERAVKDELIKL